MLVCAVAALLSISGCGQGSAPSKVPAHVAMSRAAATTGPVCGTDAHPKHAELNISCQACHPCGGVVGFTMTQTYPRGTAMTGTFDQNTKTCTVACHSPFAGTPPHQATWTTTGSLDCVACHLVPASHSSFNFPNPPTRADCTACHDMSKHTTGTVLASGHTPAWSDPTSSGFHAFSANLGLDGCTPCHGPTLDGGIGRACGACHDSNPDHPLPPGVTTWKKDCTMCHGGNDGDKTGAPPKATWGYQDDFVRIGAHRAHVAPGPLSGGYACNVCHVTPTDALAPGHIDKATATVTFGGIATQGLRPTWDAGTATCSSTYCHGASLWGGTNTKPTWTTVDGTQSACGTCHAVPPLWVWGHQYHTGCTWCHYDIASDDGTRITNPALHIDGVVEAVNRDTEPECLYCHGPW